MAANRRAHIPSKIKLFTPLLYAFLGVSCVYAGLSLFGPIDPATLAKYRLSAAQTHLLLLTVVVPLLVIWLIAYYGFAKIRNYSQLLGASNEGPAFKNIALGLGCLAFSLPVNASLGALLSWQVLRHPDAIAPLTIIRNYAALLLPLVAFILTSRGAILLAKHTKRKLKGPFHPHFWILMLVFTSCLFTWLLIERPADGRIATNVYFLPDWLIITTLAVPYLYTWFRGLETVYYIMYFQRNVKGSLYRTSLRRLSMGILTVTFVNILIQCIMTLSGRLLRLQLTPILLLIYFLVAMYAVGFSLIAAGAKKLKKIEEV